MVVPICTMGILGKRINQVARISGAITVPDVIRDRFRSASFGLLAVCLIVFFMTFNLVGQFKAGSLILKTLLQDVDAFQSMVGWLGHARSSISFLGINEVDPAYLLCLLTFGIAVIVYTTYGGFHAVVWTDVMQGVVMIIGVLIMLPLAIYAVGGLSEVGRELKEMTPPRYGFLELEFEQGPTEDIALNSPWITMPAAEGDGRRLFRVDRTLSIPSGQKTISDVKIVELTTPGEIDRQYKKLLEEAEASLAGLSQDEAARIQSQIERAKSNQISLLSSSRVDLADAKIQHISNYTYGHGKKGMYVSGPGPSPPSLKDTAAETKKAEEARGPDTSAGFLPFSLAVSFFFMWAISGSGQPSNMVRLMAFNSARTLRRSIFTVAIYYTAIYMPLVVIFCCARVILPGMDLESDRIMPQMAVTLTNSIGQGWLAGLLIAAPFAAVMSTVDSFLLMISSALVRDIYQRNLNPEAKEQTIKRLSYLATMVVGVAAMLGAVNAPKFLQDLIVYVGSGLSSCFLAPMVFGLYWPRVNKFGAISGMLAGFSAHLSMYITGMFVNGSFFKPWRPSHVDPILVGLFVSFITVYIVTKLTPTPPQDLVRRYFHKDGAKLKTPAA